VSVPAGTVAAPAAAPAFPPTGRALAAGGGAALVGAAAAWAVTIAVLGAEPATALRVLLAAFAIGSTGVLARPLWRARGLARASRRAVAAADAVTARADAELARRAAWTAAGLALAVLAAAVLIGFVAANDGAVQKTFLQWELIHVSLRDTIDAFGQNVLIALIAEALVLVWGLAVALARMAPGPAGRPVRALAVVYVDAFRGLPAIIVIYLIGFGLPLTRVPVLGDLSGMWYAVFALTLTYGAYNAEVYRAGIEGVHASQTAAARSLGFSYAQSLRHVVVPQAVRRVIPPLLNDFIALQKDTALVGVIGTIEAFNQSKIFASNHFNLSSVTVVAAIFLVITVPQARIVDRLLARQGRRRMGA
jgi:polar amino acid transport system permease protein